MNELNDHYISIPGDLKFYVLLILFRIVSQMIVKLHYQMLKIVDMKLIFKLKI